MDLVLRPIATGELDGYRRADEYGFGFRTETDGGHDEWAGAELERTIAAFDGDEIVGTGRNYSLELTLPGGAIVPAGGVSWISVRPTHRRRGILRSMMTCLLDESRSRGESASILTASEGGIYGRFGYGVATRTLSVRLDTATTRWREQRSTGRVRMLEADEASKVAPDVFERARRLLPGSVSRPAPWWIDEWSPREWVKHRFDAVCERDGRVEGYVVYSIDGTWSEGHADKAVQVRDLVATTPEAEAELWRFVCSVDLVRRVEAWVVPVDTPLPWLLTDPRQVRTTSLRDWLWLRPLDVPALLGARRFGAEARLVLEVHDPHRPTGATQGRFLLDAAADGAQCAPTRADPDLVLGVEDLGAIALGGLAPSVLARAGRIDAADRRTLLLADRLFAAERLPHCATWF